MKEAFASDLSSLRQIDKGCGSDRSCPREEAARSSVRKHRSASPLGSRPNLFSISGFQRLEIDRSCLYKKLRVFGIDVEIPRELAQYEVARIEHPEFQMLKVVLEDRRQSVSERANAATAERLKTGHGR